MGKDPRPKRPASAIETPRRASVIVTARLPPPGRDDGPAQPPFFVSYAWVDDQTFVDPLPTADHRLGWVSTFVDRLGKHLGGTLGRATEGERYWIDYERMRGGEPLGETIRAQLAAASLLLPILSPGWFASHWCLEELIGTSGSGKSSLAQV